MGLGKTVMTLALILSNKRPCSRGDTEAKSAPALAEASAGSANPERLSSVVAGVLESSSDEISTDTKIAEPVATETIDEAVVAGHRPSSSGREYLVRWPGAGSQSWVPSRAIEDAVGNQAVTMYWKNPAVASEGTTDASSVMAGSRNGCFCGGKLPRKSKAVLLQCSRCPAAMHDICTGFERNSSEPSVPVQA